MIEATVLTFVLILIRLATFWFAMPLFNTLSIPRIVKVGLSLALTIFWFAQLESIPQGVHDAVEGQLSVVQLGLLAAREVVIGGLLGFAFHLFVIPARIAGAYLGQEIGLSMAEMSDPANQEPSTVVATLMQLFALLIFFSLNLHHFVIVALHAVFEHIPVASPIAWQSGEFLAASFAETVAGGIGLIGPPALALMVLLVAILLLARAVPSFNLFSVGISIRLIGGLLIILIFLPELIARTTQSLEFAGDRIESFIHLLTHG